MKFIDKTVEVFLIIRWEKIQSVSSYVVIFGISLVGFNFWNWAWEIFFEPAGFQRESNSPAYFGLALIALGLAALVADKYATRIVPATFDQDKRIYNRSMELCPWDTVDWLLNDLHNYFFRLEHKKCLVEMFRYLELEENKYSAKLMRSRAEELISKSKDLSRHLALNFTGPNAPRSDIIDWNHDKHAQFGEPKYTQMKEREEELKKLSNFLETAFKEYQKAANKLGLVEIR